MPMSSKSMLLAITALAVFTFTAAAQDKAAAGALDSAFVGKSIFSLLPSKAKGDPADVKVHQSQAILESYFGLPDDVAATEDENLVEHED